MRHRDTKALLAKMPLGSKKQATFFRSLPINNQGFLLLELPSKQQHVLLEELSNKEIISLLHYLDPDEATDVLHHVSHHRRNAILEDLGGDIREKVEFLLKFNPKTAAGMMSLDYVEVNHTATFGEASRIIKKHEQRTGKFPTILIVQDGFLVGELPGHLLVHHKSTEKVTHHARKVPHVRYDSHQKQVVKIFKAHPHDKIVVLDDENSILGVIYSDDILRLMESQEAVTLLDFAGVSQEEDALDGAFVKVKHRYAWLILNMLLAFVAAWVVSWFETTINAFVILAAYMPLVAALGGSAGTQTLAVVVRGMALREFEHRHVRHIVMNEMTAGAINGIIVGIVVAIIAVLWNHSPLLGAVLAVAMFFNLLLAAFFGALIPLMMRSLGKDPATSATIFITTATDVCGFFVFLWLASVVL